MTSPNDEVLTSKMRFMGIFSHTIHYMKFAFIIFKYFPFGGMQRDMLRTANELVARGHSVEVFTLNWQGELPTGIKVHVLPQNGWFNFTRYQHFIDATFAMIHQGQFDYIFGYNRTPGLNAHFAADPCFIERAHKQRNWLYRLTPRYRWFAACEKAVFSNELAVQILAVSHLNATFSALVWHTNRAFPFYSALLVARTFCATRQNCYARAFTQSV